MYLIVTRTFPPELGGMQNLMWGLARSLSKLNLIKVFADYHENHEVQFIDFNIRINTNESKVCLLLRQNLYERRSHYVDNTCCN